MRLGAHLTSRIRPFAICCCLAEAFLREAVVARASRSPCLSEKIYLEGSVPGMVIRHMGSICRTATVADYFPAYRRSRSIQSSSNLTKR